MDIQVVGLLKSAENRAVHQIPFQVDHQGHANVSKYFVNHDDPSLEGTMVSTFRGRELKGKAYDLQSNNMVGVLLKEKRRPTTDVEEREFHVHTAFDSVHVWNHDSPPDASHDLDWTLNKWLPISAALHDPIE
ncbi:hypothetical protein SARC_04776 [Sphaeroforma arctica JP610]|uniref:Uncharacterized protein n=1 Tax=Sphaeroforma arctica JP610 TaxID=667725 RepID=A0A0L0G291_9EUKA|nr:hypothetical protein SARC_04776 [Sphaeroforma arctica JP610]KNC82954.1 hypothetical protein SARC_04776 [Sphaeroforma arctica JP610]|eukprot:XP_014156856.1 hypothetical protein SARC_04776 [Sphaeroforma arctica JP610]